MIASRGVQQHNENKSIIKTAKPAANCEGWQKRHDMIWTAVKDKAEHNKDCEASS